MNFSQKHTAWAVRTRGPRLGPPDSKVGRKGLKIWLCNLQVGMSSALKVKGCGPLFRTYTQTRKQ